MGTLVWVPGRTTGTGMWCRYEVLICGAGMGPGMRFGMERRYCRWRAML